MNWIRRRLNEDAKQWRKLWSIRFAIYFAMFQGGVMGLGYFEGGIDRWHVALFACNMLGYGAIAAARVFKQKGVGRVCT